MTTTPSTVNVGGIVANVSRILEKCNESRVAIIINIACWFEGVVLQAFHILKTGLELKMTGIFKSTCQFGGAVLNALYVEVDWRYTL